MKKRKLHLGKERVIGIIGIALILISLAFLYLWECGLKETLLYEPVILAKEAIDPGTVIQPDMLVTGAVASQDKIAGGLKATESIVGKVASAYIPARAQLHKRYFESERLHLKKGEYVFAVPDEWLYSYPQTIRRGDTVHFYPIGSDDSEFVSAGTREATVEATAVYVKDSANREVTDVTAERMDGSAVVSRLEVIIDGSRYAALADAAANGMQFIVMYD